jgi:phosphoglycerate dehydrogenase-like enzyme
MKARLAFIPRAYRPVVERAREMFDVAYEDRQQEPNFDPRLAALDNVFLTPHINSATRETRLALGYACLEDIAAVLAGRAPLHPAGEGIDHLNLRRRIGR